MSNKRPYIQKGHPVSGNRYREPWYCHERPIIRNNEPYNICRKCGERLGNLLPFSSSVVYSFWKFKAGGLKELVGYSHDYDCLNEDPPQDQSTFNGR